MSDRWKPITAVLINWRSAVLNWIEQGRTCQPVACQHVNSTA